MNKIIVWAVLITTIMILSCAALKNIVDIKKPEVRIDNVSVSSLSFESIGLVFDIGITNPNQLSVKLGGFDYSLSLDDQNFLNGEKNEEVYIESLQKSSIKIPMTLNFQEIYKSYQALDSKDSVRYQLKAGLIFDLPVLGNTRIPVQTDGEIPLLKLPSITISSLSLNNFSFTGASLDLKLLIKNPNPISIGTKQLNYYFSVNGLEWISGLSQTQQEMESNDNSIINIPITLNFLQMGQTVYQIISGNNAIHYQFKGGVKFDSSHPLLQEFNLPFYQTGQLNIQK
jgi:LEA14-like dessication related protein